MKWTLSVLSCGVLVAALVWPAWAASPAARVGHQVLDPGVFAGTTPCVGGPIITGSSDVLIGGFAAARVNDSSVSLLPGTLVEGSASVLINNRPAARLGDSAIGSGTGVISQGDGTVIIGD